MPLNPPEPPHNPQFFRQTDIGGVPGLPRELVGYGEHPPRVRWQNDAKVAVQVVVNYEEGSEKTFAMGDQTNDGMYELPFAVEDRVDQPLSLYAATKKSAELMSETYANLYRLPLTGLRFFTVYGPWGRPDMMMWIFTQKILAGESIPVFNNGDMWRDFTYVDDIIAGVIACIDSPPPDDGAVKAGGSHNPHRLYNIGNNQSEHLMKVIGILEEQLGKKAVIDFKPMQQGDVPKSYADIDAINGDLGYKPATMIEVGVPNFVRWYRGYHAG